MRSHMFTIAAGLAAFAFTSAAYANGQCPAIGLSSSCSILITINPNGSLTFKSDPSVQPFDGEEDVLVGVFNNSGASVFGISLSGDNIFGLTATAQGHSLAV